MARPLIECSNCNQQFEAHYPYCPYCGQQAEIKLTIGVLFNNTISNYFSVDARFFRSFVPLMLRPGYLAKKFVDGKRIQYLHPAQFYLFMSIVFFFLFSFISRKQAEDLDTNFDKMFHKNEAVHDSIQDKKSDSLEIANLKSTLKKNKFITGINETQIDSIIDESSQDGNNGNFGLDNEEIDSLIAIGADNQTIYKQMGMEDDDNFIEKSFYKQYLKYYKSRSFGSILKAFYDTIPIAMFILLPIFALILKLFFYRKGRFAHHLVFTFYFFSFLFMTFTFLLICNFAWEEFPGFITFLVMLSTFFYLMLGIKNFYGKGYFVSFVKSSVITFLFLTFVIPTAAVLIGLMAFLFY